MRMGILFGRPAMGCPPRVADAVVAIHGVHADDFFEVAEFSRGAAHTEGMVVTIDGETGGIIAAVFEPLQIPPK